MAYNYRRSSPWGAAAGKQGGKVPEGTWGTGKGKVLAGSEGKGGGGQLPERT